MVERKVNGLLVALTDCTDLSKEAEFNKWYNETLIPNIKELDFIGRVTRYENVLSDSPTYLGVPKYLALWEIYHEDLDFAFDKILARDAELKEAGQGFENMVRKVDTMYKRITPKIRSERSDRPVKGVYTVFCYNTDPAREDEFNEWYNEKHAPETLDLGFLDSVTRYQIVDKNKPEPHQTPYLSVYETSMDPLEARNSLVASRWKWEPDTIWMDLLGLNYTGGYRLIYSTE